MPVSASHGNAPTIDAGGVRIINGTAEQAAAMEAALNRIETTDAGRAYAELLREDRVRVEFVEFGTHGFEGLAKGKYYPHSEAIRLTTSNLDNKDPAKTDPLVEHLVHEAVHHQDMQYGGHGPGQATASGIARAATSMLGSIFSLSNPLTAATDAFHARQLQTEVNAFRVQRAVADELGLRTGGSPASVSDGTEATDDKVRSALLRDAGYGIHGTDRLPHLATTGATLWAGGTLAGSMLLKRAGVGRHRLFAGLGMAAITAGFAAFDLHSHWSAPPRWQLGTPGGLKNKKS